MIDRRDPFVTVPRTNRIAHHPPVPSACANFFRAAELSPIHKNLANHWRRRNRSRTLGGIAKNRARKRNSDDRRSRALLTRGRARKKSVIHGLFYSRQFDLSGRITFSNSIG